VVRRVLIEWDGLGNLLRHRVDGDRDAELVEGGASIAIEVGDGRS
jgi:hypothetical protein